MDYDRGSGPYRDGRPVHSSDLHQAALNESWPLKDRTGRTHAEGIKSRPPIDVWVRVVWENDGEEVIPARATRWNRSHVFCEWADPRLVIFGLWVRARDVRRRE